MAEQSLDWRRRLEINESLAWTADWHGAQAPGENMLSFFKAHIARCRALPVSGA
jgi:hypothetical protein